jgi:formiminoglutamase
MLEQWLRPSDVAIEEDIADWMIGGMLPKFDDITADWSEYSVVFVGIDAESADPIRRELYHMANVWGQGEIADLGNLLNPSVEFLISLLQQLHRNRVVVILLGGDYSHLRAQVIGRRDQEQLVNLTLFDELVRWDIQDNANVLKRLLNQDPVAVQSLTLIGWQKAYSSPVSVSELQRLGHELIRLGIAQADKAGLEPLVRESDIIALHTSVLDPGLAPDASDKRSAVGLYLDETCQIARYAAASHRVFSMQVMGMGASENPQTARSISHIVWYMLDGVFSRVYEYPRVEGAQWFNHIVMGKGNDWTFWSSGVTKRWWLELQMPDDKVRYIPCTKAEYEAVAANDLPERFFRIFQRLGLEF